MSNINGEVALALALDGRASVYDRETADLLAVADALRNLPDPQIDPVFANALEQRLMNEAFEQAPTGRPSLRLVEPETPVETEPVIDVVVSLPRRRVAMRRSIVAIAAAMTLSAFPVLAAAKALPGSPFYGLKQKIHAAQIALFGDAFADADRRLGFAAEHIWEAEQLVALGADSSLVGQALDMAAYEISRAEQTVVGENDSERLAGFAAKAAETEALLAKSAPVLAPEATEAFDRAMDASRSLTQAVAKALGITDEGTLSRILSEVAPTAPTAPGSAPTVSEPTTGTTSTTTSTDHGSTTDKGATDDGGNKGSDQPAGKAVQGAKSYGCQLPGQYELEALLGQTDEVCASATL
ncbi:MAG: DUF5667 domain-containing protein [Actinomycetota bacterium]